MLLVHMVSSKSEVNAKPCHPQIWFYNYQEGPLKKWRLATTAQMLDFIQKMTEVFFVFSANKQQKLDLEVKKSSLILLNISLIYYKMFFFSYNTSYHRLYIERTAWLSLVQMYSFGAKLPLSEGPCIREYDKKRFLSKVHISFGPPSWHILLFLWNYARTAAACF